MQHEARPSSVPPSPASVAHSRGLIRSNSVPPNMDQNSGPLGFFSLPFLTKAFADYENGIQDSMLCIISVLEHEYSHDSITIDTELLNLLSSFIETLNQTFISKLSSRYSLLIKAILNINWTRFEPKANSNTTLFDSSYSIFFSRISDWILNIISAYLPHLNVVLESIIGALYTISTFAESSSFINRTKSQLFSQRIHAIIGSLIKIVPSLQPAILLYINDFFPHPRQIDSHDYLSAYFSECIKICHYWPEIRPSLLELLISKVIQIDVEVQIEVDELEDDLLEHLECDILDDSEAEHNDSHSSDEDEDYDDANFDHDASQQDILDEDSSPIESNSFDSITTIKALISRLDSCLLMIFKFIEKIRTEDTEASFASLFISLLAIFEKVMLPTMRSRYTQFILFYITSLDERFPDYFLGILMCRLSGSPSNLISSFNGTGGPSICDSMSWIDALKLYSGSHFKSSKPHFGLGSFDTLKLFSACYIGGYVARAKFISKRTVRKCLLYLLSWTGKYIQNHGCSDCRHGLLCKEVNGSTSKTQFAYKHSIFFSISQAIFYILCFRHDEVLLNDSLYEDVSYTDLKQYLLKLMYNGCLSPLSSILSTISSEFLKIAELYYPDLSPSCELELKTLLTPINSRSNSPILNSNSLPVGSFFAEDTVTVSAQLRALESLETFFPFDPFKLPNSKLFISKSIFIDWPEYSASKEEVLAP